MLIRNCPSYRDYDVFGYPSKGCCFCYMEYCNKVKDCKLKEIVKMCKEENTNFSRLIVSKLKVEESS